MTAFPKSVEAPVKRFFYTRMRETKGKKNGGMVAVLKLPETEWNDVQVYQPDIDGEQWWSHLGQGMVIRASVREIAQNKEDLIAWALPLKNQPTATQEAIRARMADEQKDLNLPAPDGDQLEEQLKKDIKQKQERSIQLAQAKRLQRLALMGQWLEGNEKALTMAQGMICNAFFEWCDDHSEDADSKCLHEMMDAIHYIIELGGKLRSNCWCPDKDYDGVLYYNDSNGKPIKVIDLNELS